MIKILSIDDEAEILECFRDALTAEGYVFLSSTDPEEGLRLIRETPDLDLVMLDVKMPGKNGFEIYTEMREFRQLPVLFVTAYPSSFDPNKEDIIKMWEEQFADGTTDILYKPFELDTLYSKVAGLVGPADG
ncbi:MAG: response regulator [Verrucomicrobia bacterium]|nr:response regulator [Verrucomicrobiota bacterium]